MRNLGDFAVFMRNGLPDYKPVSVHLRVAVIHLGRALLPSSSDLPGSKAERTAPPPLFGLAPRGVCLTGRIAPAAVRSYRTISPLPRKRRYIFCCTFREKRFERVPPAVSRHAVLRRPDFPLLDLGATARPASRLSLSHVRANFCCPVLQFGSILFIVMPGWAMSIPWVP